MCHDSFIQVPGYIPEAMCGKSFAYLTGYRKMLLLDGAAMATEYTRSGREAHRLQPKQVLRKTEDVPRHIVLGMDATTCNRPMSSMSSHQKSKWESKDQFYTTLNLCPTGHMPGYRGETKPCDLTVCSQLPAPFLSCTHATTHLGVLITFLMSAKHISSQNTS